MRPALLLLLVGVVAGCRRERVVGANSAPGDSMDGAAKDSSAAFARVATRCHATERGILLDDGGGLGDLEVGDGIAYAGGYAVALVHRTAIGRVPAVALLHGDDSGAGIVDLMPTIGDVPPPRLASCRDKLVAAAFGPPTSASLGRAARDANRDLVIYIVDAVAPAQPILSIAQRRDDSLAFDLACSGASGLAVWDETARASRAIGARGVVRAAAFDVGKRTMHARDLSSPDSNAEMPRVVPSRGGFFVVWLARQPETASDDATSSSRAGQDARPSLGIESPGETRAYAWLEMVELDTEGNATAPVRRLTPTSGHVSAFDIRARPDSPTDGILVVARDDGESVDGSGGVLLRVRAHGDSIDVPVTLPTDGLGRGAPTLVDVPAKWVAWVGAREDLRLLPLGPTGEVAGPASVEDGLDNAIPLLSVEGDGRMLVADPTDKTAQLRVFVCQR